MSEVIDMNNDNALVALAYIKTCENPLTVFCNYIMYVLSTTSDYKLRVDELRIKVFEKFGLDMPHQIMSVCVRILKKNKKLSMLPNGAGYQLEGRPFNIQELDGTLLRLHKQEDLVVEGLIAFIQEHYKQSWTKEEAKRYLSNFLDKQGRAAEIFLDGEIREMSGNALSHDLYIGRFVENLSEDKNSTEWSYLVELIYGMMIYQGVYQTHDYERDKGKKFKGTRFFLDTKLVLRAMGFSNSIHVQATEEFIKLVTEEYAGKICVFDETISEVRNALYNASAAYSKKDFIYDSEIRAYTVLNKEGASLLYEFAEAAEQFICDKLMFEKVENIDWDVHQTRRSTIDMAGLTLFMKELHPEWKIGSVDNDISVINKINILRKGDYSERFGGYKKLPIFVTTNSELVYSIREYAKKQVKDGRGAMWNLHALPVVSDNMVLFRLWAPVAQKCSNLPAITLSRYAYSAQNADERFFIELRRKSISYRSARGVDIINVSDSIRKKLEDIIITNTMGQVENISNQVMAASVEELIKLENEGLHIENRKLKYAEIEKSCRLEDKSRRVIELCASRYSNRLGLMRPLIWVAKYWWIIAAFILLILSMLFDTTLGWLAFALPVFAQMVLFCLGKYLSNESIEYWLLKPVIRLVIKTLSRRVKEGVSDSELDCVDDIISEVINNTRILKKYKRFWEGEGHCGIL